jgi:hypothetical protein
MGELFVANAPFHVINLATLFVSHVKAFIRLRNVVFTGYQFEECKIVLTNNVHDRFLLINRMGVVRVPVRQVV